jgi:hypothetical protein
MTQSFSVHCTNFYSFVCFYVRLYHSSTYIVITIPTIYVNMEFKVHKLLLDWYYCKVLECSCKSKRHIGDNSTRNTNRLTFCKWMHGLFIWCCLDCPCVCGDLPFAMRKKAWIYLKFSPPWTVHYCFSFCLFEKGK